MLPDSVLSDELKEEKRKSIDDDKTPNKTDGDKDDDKPSVEQAQNALAYPKNTDPESDNIPVIEEEVEKLQK